MVEDWEGFSLATSTTRQKVNLGADQGEGDINPDPRDCYMDFRNVAPEAFNWGVDLDGCLATPMPPTAVVALRSDGRTR